MEKEFQLSLRCVFCDSTKFEVDGNKVPKDGGMIKCGTCGKLNDFSSLKELVKQQGRTKVITDVEKELQAIIKRRRRG